MVNKYEKIGISLSLCRICAICEGVEIKRSKLLKVHNVFQSGRFS